MTPEERFLETIKKIAHYTHDGQTASKLYDAIKNYEEESFSEF